MSIYKPEKSPDDSEVVYICDNCGAMSSFSDYRWPGHKHWSDLNYTLCNDCLRNLSSGRDNPAQNTADGKK